jgi:hypothetical protein
MRGAVLRALLRLAHHAMVLQRLAPTVTCQLVIQDSSSTTSLLTPESERGMLSLETKIDTEARIQASPFGPCI